MPNFLNSVSIIFWYHGEEFGLKTMETIKYHGHPDGHQEDQPQVPQQVILAQQVILCLKKIV